MKTSIETAWTTASNRALAVPVKSGNFVIFRVDARSDKNIYGGVDSSGCVLLAIEVQSLPPLMEIRSAALDFFRHKRKGPENWLMVIRLRQPELTPVFGRLCQDLIDEIQSLDSNVALLEVVRNRIELWQKLFENAVNGLLADFQVKGLLAELLYMESQLVGGLRQPLEVANGWVGPSGADQDFIFSDESVEVKAIGPNSRGVTINSLQQLESMAQLRLSVWTLRSASPSESIAETLNDVAARIERILSPLPAALALFHNSLLEAGYVSHQHYDEIAFEPMLSEEFLVNEDFPRLITSSVPTGILSAAYVVSLQMIRAGD